ncbi:MAG: hypothetical protein KDC92_06030, partial [Bacteroidetes bacterium]|nr:hypothetical protein [Bacteroidota bacterium]
HLKDTFPQYGIRTPERGWLNVGKQRAKFNVDSIIYNEKNVWIDGSPTLNETKYRISVCEFNTMTSQCLSSTTHYPDNSLDTFYGGRISKMNLSLIAALQRGKSYKITLTAKNDCDDISIYSKVVSISTELEAVVSSDTLICGGYGTLTAHGHGSSGSFDSLKWTIWEYSQPFAYDSSTYVQNADTFLVKIDTQWIEKGVSFDTIIIDTLWYYYADTLASDSSKFQQDYLNYFDTLVNASLADTFNLSGYYFKPDHEYAVVLTLFNGCTWAHDTLKVRTLSGPTVNAGPDRYMGAAHSSVTNDDPVLHGTVSGHTGSHTWSPTTQMAPSSSLYPTVWPSTTREYVLSATDANGCTNYDTVTVWVNSFANAGSDTTICYDDSALIGIPTVSGYTYEWFQPSQVSDDEIAEPYGYPNQYADSVIIRLKVTDNSQNVEWDEMVIYRDTTIDPTFSQTPAGGPGSYAVQLDITENAVLLEALTWDFGDGSPSGSGNQTSHTYPPIPSATYNT